MKRPSRRHISLIQRDSMRATFDVGDAAMHRGFLPTEQELNVALDVVKGCLLPSFGHKTEAEKLADRVAAAPAAEILALRVFQVTELIGKRKLLLGFRSLDD